MAAHPLVKMLSEIVKASGLPHIKIAQATGYSPSHLSKIIQGKRRPSVDSLVNYYNTLGYDLVVVKKEEK